MKSKGHGFEILNYANNNWKQIDILHLRIDLLGYIRSFSKHPREIWNRIVKIILEQHKNRSGQNISKAYFSDYEIIENMKLNFMK